MEETYNKVFFVTGGGTGGHIYPALAVAKGLADEGARIFYVGSKKNMEYELASKNGYEFLNVNVTGMPRKINPKLFLWLFRLVMAIYVSVRYLKKYKPTAVFATGGYVSAPMIFACQITKVPYMMHDCDAMPGLVTRKLSKRAKYVSLAFEKAKQYIQNKNVTVTGNPIRERFATLTQQEARDILGLSNKITICIMGGSQGARSINNTVVELLKELSNIHNIQIIFQTGNKNYEGVIEKLKLLYPNFENDSNIIIKPYFEDMITILKASDIVVARSGSLSLSEICASNLAPILIPYPYAAANHQRLNAKTLLDAGACVYIEDAELEPNKLKQVITELINNPTKINYLKQNASRLAKYDATSKITDLLKTIR